MEECPVRGKSKCKGPGVRIMLGLLRDSGKLEESEQGGEGYEDTEAREAEATSCRSR